MKTSHDRPGRMFADVPRPWGLAGAMTIGLWILITLAFVTDAVPAASSEEWLYRLEARRAAWAHQLSASEARHSAQVAARRAQAAHRASSVAAVAEDASCSCN